MSATESYLVEVPAQSISATKSFERMRQAAYGENDAQKRTEQLRSLVASAHTSDGNPLEDALLEQVFEQLEADQALAESDARFERISRKAAQKALERYSFEMDENGEVTDIGHIITLHEDTSATARNKRLQTRIGYGPRQNRSSFKSSTHVKGQRRT